MTPAAAQLVSGFQSGSLKSAFSPDLHAIVLLAPDGHYAIPVTVSVPGNRIRFEKEGDGFTAPMTLVLVTRDSKGNIVSSSQRTWTIRADRAQRDDLQKRTMSVQQQVAASGLEPLSVQAILRMPENMVVEGHTTISVPAGSDAGPKMTSILLSNRLEQATCTDSSDPLCMQNVRFSQPTAMEFPALGRLVVYFAASDLALDPQTKKPRVGVVFAIKSGEQVIKSVNAENVQALPGPLPNSVLVLAEYDLKALQPGNYTLQAVTQDMVRHASLSQQTSFVVQ
jgi:hypothetical protein